LGDKTFGKVLPSNLELKRIEIEVGRSSQATLLGREETTIESLYLSPSLSSSLANNEIKELSYIGIKPKQLTLLEEHGQFSTATR
jgi:DNA adenine methylase